MSAMIVAVLALAPIFAAEPPKPEKARMVFYSGNVQGVGFRATTADIAKDYPVTGWVKNLDDGRVQLLAEGPAEAVDKFLKAVHRRWDANIEKEEVEKPAPTGKYQSFEIVK